jgi:hypothetical protein
MKLSTRMMQKDSHIFIYTQDIAQVTITFCSDFT